MIVVIAKEGHTECELCPFYVAEGCVKVYGGDRNTKCGILMKPYWLDCNKYDMSTIRVARVDNRSIRCFTRSKALPSISTCPPDRLAFIPPMFPTSSALPPPFPPLLPCPFRGKGRGKGLSPLPPFLRRFTTTPTPINKPEGAMPSALRPQFSILNSQFSIIMIFCIISEVLITLALLPLAAIIAIFAYYIFGYIFLLVLFMVCHYTIAEAHREAVNELNRPLLK